MNEKNRQNAVKILEAWLEYPLDGKPRRFFVKATGTNSIFSPAYLETRTPQVFYNGEALTVKNTFGYKIFLEKYLPSWGEVEIILPNFRAEALPADLLWVLEKIEEGEEKRNLSPEANPRAIKSQTLGSVSVSYFGENEIPKISHFTDADAIAKIVQKYRDFSLFSV